MSKNNSKSNKLCFILLTVFLLGSAGAEKNNDESFKFSEISCWDLLTLSDEERPYALTMVYGYHAGLNKKDTHANSKIEEVLTKAGNSCEKMPDSKVLDVLNQLMK